MARQKGIIKLQGRVGDLSFYKTKDGYLAREKGGIDGQRIASDPAFQRTRENGKEFGNAGSSGKLLRNALRVVAQKVKDSRMTSRLTREMLKVVKSDTRSIRGERNILAGDLALLKGFEFNADGKLGTSLFIPFELKVDRAGGLLDILIPDFVPGDSIALPQGATHFRFISAAAEIDFEKESFNVDVNNSSEIVLGPQQEAALVLSNSLPAASTLPLFLVMGIEFLQEVNGMMYPLRNGAFNALQLVEVDMP